VLGGEVVAEIAEINGNGTWQRGYVYLGGQLVAVQQQNAVYWVHQDPVAKSKRVTNSSGNVVSTVELDPWGGNTNRNNNDAFQPHKFNNYERDGNASDEAMFRRYNRWYSKFDQPDPYNGSYNLADPQSFNRYAYVQNDPVNFVDPTGLFTNCGQNGLPPCPSDNPWEDLPSPIPLPVILPIDPPDPPGPPAEPPGPQNTPARFDNATFNGCVDALFGVTRAPSNDGKNVGLTPLSSGIGSYTGFSLLTLSKFTIYTDGRSKDSKQLAIEGGATPGKTAFGYTPPNAPYLNWIASDYVQNPSVSPIFNLANQIHETGNSIAGVIAQKFHGYVRPKPLNPGPFEGDTDSGAALEECVFGGAVLPGGTVRH
jgi:RHS repeat-associated protein